METSTALPLEFTPAAQTIATAKYLYLAKDKLGAELGYQSGWRGVVATKLGISASLLSQILNGRKVTRGTLEKAITALGLPADYFGSIENVRTVPPTIPPPALSTSPVTGPDPLLVLDAYRALSKDVRRRLLPLLQMVDGETN